MSNRISLIVPMLISGVLLAAVADLAMADQASAMPICASGKVQAVVVGTRTVGPYCVPYSYGTTCDLQTLGLTGTFEVSTVVCFPSV